MAGRGRSSSLTAEARDPTPILHKKWHMSDIAVPHKFDFILKCRERRTFRIARGHCLNTANFAVFRQVALLTRIMFGEFARQCRSASKKNGVNAHSR